VIARNRLTVIGTCSSPVEVRKRPAGFRRLRLCRPPAPESRRPETPARVKCPGQRSARRLRRRPRGRFDRLLPLRHGFWSKQHFPFPSWLASGWRGMAGMSGGRAGTPRSSVIRMTIMRLRF